jgi:hypothetical protein
MEVDARMRRRVHARLEELMGAEMADAVMEMFPPAGWRGVATRDDVERVAAELRGEVRGDIGELRGELRGGLAKAHGEIAELRGELRSGLAKAHGEIAQLRGEVAGVRGELRAEIRATALRLLMAHVASVVAIAGIVLVG